GSHLRRQQRYVVFLREQQQRDLPVAAFGQTGEEEHLGQIGPCDERCKRPQTVQQAAEPAPEVQGEMQGGVADHEGDSMAFEESGAALRTPIASPSVTAPVSHSEKSKSGSEALADSAELVSLSADTRSRPSIRDRNKTCSA